MRNATALSCKSAQGPPLGCGLGLGDEYNAGLGCPMLMFTGSVLVQGPITNGLMMHLGRLLVAVGLHPMHCSLNLFIFKEKHMFNSHEVVQ